MIRNIPALKKDFVLSNETKKQYNPHNKNNRGVYLYDIPNYLGDLVNLIGGERSFVDKQEVYSILNK
ncbi:MAG: hypothetical protein ACK5KT_01865 [Dysgonomonas sp.]